MMKSRDWEGENRCEWRRMKRKNITRPVGNIGGMIKRDDF
jgi:hypothetical protein